MFIALRKGMELWKKFIILLVAIMIVFSVALGLIVYKSTKNIVELTLKENSMILARNVVNQLDSERYEQLVKNPNNHSLNVEIVAYVGLDIENSIIYGIQKSAVTKYLPILLGIVILLNVVMMTTLYLYMRKSLKQLKK